MHFAQDLSLAFRAWARSFPASSSPSGPPSTSIVSALAPFVFAVVRVVSVTHAMHAVMACIVAFAVICCGGAADYIWRSWTKSEEVTSFLSKKGELFSSLFIIILD